MLDNSHEYDEEAMTKNLQSLFDCNEWNSTKDEMHDATHVNKDARHINKDSIFKCPPSCLRSA